MDKPKKKSLLSGVIKTAFEGVKPSWRKLFLGPLKPQLNECFRKLNARLLKLGVTREMIDKNGINEYIRPDNEDIFNAFKHCEISDIRVIIVGQDPYPRAEEAHGLSFSSVGSKIPKSLNNVYKCLIETGAIAEMPRRSDLTRWTRQGVLLLNRYLTRNPTLVDDGDGYYVKGNGGSGSSNTHPFWCEFTDAVVTHLAKLAEKNNAYLCVMLWGAKAQEMEGVLSHAIMAETIDLQIWGSPSPANVPNMKPGPANFVHCDHFTHVNEELASRGLPVIDWNPRRKKVAVVSAEKPPDVFKENVKTVVYTDGGCTGNGKKSAKGSFGTHFPKTFRGVANSMTGNFYGLVPLVEFKDIGPAHVLGTKKIQPSNNRGEMLAIMIALREIINSGSSGPWLIVTDSEYCMHIINERVWKWVAKKIVKQKANPDMVTILHSQLLELEKKCKPLLQPAAATHYLKKTPMKLDWGGLTILHQNSHLKVPPKEANALELYKGNDAADKLCNQAFALTDYEIHS
jgi:uracil-DNA glycosylase